MNGCLSDLIDELWRWNFKSLPNEVKNECIKAIIDTVGVAILGYEYSDVSKAYGKIIAVELDAGSTVLGGWWKSKPIYASSINSFSSHILEYDDWLRPGFVHAGSVIIPSVLAYGENHVDWKRCIEAVVIGYEAMARIGAAAGREHYSYWHTTGTAGAIASAIAVSKLLDLTVEQACNAAALAGYFTSGLWGFISAGSSAKPLSPAHASLLGGLSCELIQNNVKTNTLLFEGNRGFKVIAPNIDLAILKNPPWNYAILHNGYKLYPCCRHTHTAIYCAINLSKQIDIGKVNRIEIQTFSEAIKIAGIDKPMTVDQAKFSIKYLVAATLKYGKLGLKELNAGLFDSDVNKLMKITEVVVDDEYSRLFPEKQPTSVRLNIDDKIIEDYQETPPGDPANPASIMEIKDKVYPYISNKSRQVLDNIFNLLYIDKKYDKIVKLS